ncbi:unnamed protein product [Callosobruchus maculatus]|uniref:Uncharacterized protein n=1 Tax=Callosobruchus maculatus TaxID=64391 RepID=A0A653CJI5_CALMS|nr:unnamed protein product [Callosobruchus maculatus]
MWLPDIFETLKLSTCFRISSEHFQCLSDFVCSDKCLFDFFRPKVTINKQEAGELIDLSSVLITRIFSSTILSSCPT